MPKRKQKWHLSIDPCNLFSCAQNQAAERYIVGAMCRIFKSLIPCQPIRFQEIIGMVWVLEKKVFYHILDMGFESVGIPVRVKFEFEVQDGSFVPDSLSKEHLYNLQAVKKQYPHVKSEILERDIVKTIQIEIEKYLIENGFL